MPKTSKTSKLKDMLSRKTVARRRIEALRVGKFVRVPAKDLAAKKRLSVMITAVQSAFVGREFAMRSEKTPGWVKIWRVE